MSAWTNRETILREVSDRWCLTGVVFCPHTLVNDEKILGLLMMMGLLVSFGGCGGIVGWAISASGNFYKRNMSRLEWSKICFPVNESY